jgi:hypothetical protein
VVLPSADAGRAQAVAPLAICVARFRGTISGAITDATGAGDHPVIDFPLGHASVQTTERYLGCKQKLRQAVNDNLGIEDA